MLNGESGGENELGRVMEQEVMVEFSLGNI